MFPGMSGTLALASELNSQYLFEIVIAIAIDIEIAIDINSPLKPQNP
jgi:hypothetical protein